MPGASGRPPGRFALIPSSETDASKRHRCDKWTGDGQPHPRQHSDEPIPDGEPEPRPSEPKPYPPTRPIEPQRAPHPPTPAPTTQPPPIHAITQPLLAPNHHPHAL